jgi:probable selenium-dependent hydroxylase accessory protein YqeC
MYREDLTSIKIINSLKEALDIHPKEVISLVGAGGKTTLMFALAQELSNNRGIVITTTTTKIFPPSSSCKTFLFLSPDEDTIVNFIIKDGIRFGHITVCSRMLADSGKLKGIHPEFVLKLKRLRPINYIIVEANGADRKPLKAPNPEFEPVIPRSSTLVLPVVGIDALGCRLSEENVFRSKIASKLTGLPLGEPVSAEAIVTLILHPSGIMRGSPDQARVIPFINKTDLHGDLSEARDIASKILGAGHPRIDRVVLGQAQLRSPVAEVVFKR